MDSGKALIYPKDLHAKRQRENVRQGSEGEGKYS
jgi:hypothetical protein